MSEIWYNEYRGGKMFIAFINKNTFEIKDELDEYIYCDYEIRNVIAILNRKGYKTAFSCAGHNDVGLLWPIHKEDINKLDEYLNEARNDKSLHFIEKDNEYFYHKDEKTATYPYISFQHNYNFQKHPRNFKYELVENKSYLSKKIDFYKDKNHTIRKTDVEIYTELEQTYSDLEKWANELPLILEKM